MINIKSILSIFLLTLVVICLTGNLSARTATPNKLFNEISRIELKLDDVVFALITDIVPLPDGFVLIIKESYYGKTHSLIKLSKKGDFICKFDRRGNGPGEIGEIENTIVKENSILVAERFAPFVHEYSYNLQFIKDYRIKKGGKIFLLGDYIGIWSLNYRKIGNVDKTYILALYDRNTFQFKRVTFEIPEVPQYVHRLGGMCRVDNNTYAGVYSTRYQIYLLDKQLQYKESLIKKVPGHIKKYYPSKLPPNNFDMKSKKWLESWSKINSVLYIDGKFIIKYYKERTCYLDIVGRDGTIIFSKYRESKNRGYHFVDNSNIMYLEWNDDKTEFFLIKSRLNL